MSIIIRGGEERPSRSHEYSNWPPFGMYHATAQKKLYEPQRTTDFEFVIVGTDGWLNVAGGGELKGAGEIIRYAVQSLRIPHYTVTPQTDRRGNSIQKFAGVAQWDSGSVVVKDYIGADSKSALMTWLHQAYDVYTDKTGLLEDYKRDCMLIEYTPDRQIVRTWTVYGCWVSQVDEQDWDHTSENSMRTLTATIQFDKAILDPGAPGVINGIALEMEEPGRA